MIKRVLCLILLLFTINVKAIGEDSCDKAELNRLKELASHLSFTYEFIEGEPNQGHITGTFDIIVDNIPKDLKVMIIHSWETLEYDEFVPNSQGTGKLTGITPGQKIKITVKAYVDNGCVAKDVMTRTISLPYIHPFIGTEECNESPNFKYCRDKLTNVNISTSTFKSEYQKFLKEKELGNPEYVTNNIKIYIALALMILIPLAIIIKNTVTKIIEKRKDEI